MILDVPFEKKERNALRQRHFIVETIPLLPLLSLKKTDIS